MGVLVTGATGTIGPLLVDHLLSNGHFVRVFSRHKTKPLSSHRNLDIIQGDIRDPASLSKAMDQVDVVFHLAAKLHINNPSPELYDEYYQINVQGSANVAKAVVENNVDRLVHFSTINVYGASHKSSELFDEISPYRPQSIYAESKAEAEKAILEIFRNLKSSSMVILRLAAVYGPQMQGNYGLLVKALRNRLFWPIGPCDNRRTLVFIDDLIRGALLAAVHPKAAGEVYNLTDGRTHTLMQIIEAISNAIGRKPPRIHIPENYARFMAATADKALAFGGRSHARLGVLIEKLLEDVAVSGDKMCRDLGFRPQVPLLQGWQRAVYE